jgi:hypothetical protein
MGWRSDRFPLGMCPRLPERRWSQEPDRSIVGRFGFVYVIGRLGTLKWNPRLRIHKAGRRHKRLAQSEKETIMSNCYECDRTGECPSCHGVGHGLTSKCVICIGTGACQQCNPRGNVANRINAAASNLRRNLRVLLFIAAPIVYFLYRMYFKHRYGCGRRSPSFAKLYLPSGLPVNR